MIFCSKIEFTGKVVMMAKHFHFSEARRNQNPPLKKRICLESGSRKNTAFVFCVRHEIFLPFGVINFLNS
jgi:hypothetical protein